ncbi:MAG TPA: IS110 family transposase [Pirellulales bacterium]
MTIVNSARLFVGLDYHQDFVQVCILDETGKVVKNVRIDNDWRKIAAVAPTGAVIQAALEACCGAADLADELVEQAGWSVSLAHPGYVARMKQNPDKTDYSDARLLADLTRVGYLPKVWLAPAELRELRRLVRYRQQKAGERRDVKLRIRAILRDQRIKIDVGRPWTRQWLAALADLQQIGPDSEWILQEHLTSLARLKREIRDVERRLEERVANDAVVQKLREQKGIGLVTAATMRAEIGRFDRFQTGKQLARFCGLTPRNCSSGNKQADAGVIRAGNPQLRAVIVEAVHRIIPCDERWMRLAQQLKQRGKHICVVVAAVANRYMRWLHHTMQPEALAA